MPKCAVIVLTTGDVRGVIMASANDTPYPGTMLIEIPDKANIDGRFTWDKTDGFQPKQEYLDKVAAKVSDPHWKADKPNLTMEWDKDTLTFVYKDIV